MSITKISDVWTKDRNGDYRTKVEYVPRKVDKAKWEAYHAADHACFVQFKSDLRLAFEAEIGKKLSDKAWESIFHHVWEEGHASGYNEVAQYASDIADIVIAVMEAGQ